MSAGPFSKVAGPQGCYDHRGNNRLPKLAYDKEPFVAHSKMFSDYGGRPVGRSQLGRPKSSERWLQVEIRYIYLQLIIP